jgi:Asp/Glu/hydantoin racemase
MREIVLLNGNTTAALTDRMVAEAERLSLQGVTFRGLTAPFGEPYVSDRASFATASHAIVEMARALRETPPAAAIVACFGDPGLWAAREIQPCPVIGMAEAALHTACQMAPRVGIVTGGVAWGPMLRELAAATGLADRLAAIETLSITGGEIAADPDAALPSITAHIAALAEAGAGVAILGGAALAGLGPRLREAAPIPVIDGLACAVAQAHALAVVHQS